MKFTLSFDTDNAAFFEGDVHEAIAHTLRELACRVQNGDIAQQYRNVKDVNGNIVGTYRLA